MSDHAETRDRVLLASGDAPDGPEDGPATPAGARMIKLYEAHAASLIRFGTSLAGNPEKAMKAVQQAFTEYLQAPPGSGEERWLYHRVRQLLGQTDGTGSDEKPPKSSGTETSLVYEWLANQEVLARLRGRLSEREFEILVMRLDGASYTQISRRLDISIGTVASTLARSVKKARAMIEEEQA
jgi:RNA polymerase sigma factor (sigma-70 family)